MLLCKQEKAGIQLSAEQADWRDDNDDKPKNQELKAHYMYIEKVQEERMTRMIDKERVLLASLIEKLKCEIDENKKRNKSLETSNKAFQEANKELGAVNMALSKDIEKVQLEIVRYRDMKCEKDAKNDCAKAYGLLAQQKASSKKSFNDYTQKIIYINKKISEMEKELSSHQKRISTISYEEEQKWFYKTREEKEIEKVISLEN
ncbi:hypothetical protein Tco_1355894 [Tanacetum coccineum]